jgi:hypothetical protein
MSCFPMNRNFDGCIQVPRKSECGGEIIRPTERK